MTMRHLKIFVTVCNHRSITKAGEILYLAQPSVSLAVKELEQYYGVKLFDRMSRKLIITEAGKKIFEYSSHILSLLDEMENTLADWNTAGRLRIGTSITIGNYLLPLYIRRFKQDNPQIKINVTIDNSQKIESMIIKNDIDFALIEGIVHDNSIIIQEKFMSDELVFVCANNHVCSNADEIDIETLKNQDFILREKGSASRDMLDSIMNINGIEITPAWQSICTQAIIGAVKNCFGISVLPYLLVKKDLEDGILHRIKVKNIMLKREYSVIYHKNKVLTNSMRKFIDICGEDI